jgi:Flp pilus assembly protein TadD
MSTTTDDRYDQILGLYDAGDFQPDGADGWRELAEALLLDGRTAEATEAFRQAVELRPDDAAALVDLAHVVYAAGNVEEATSYATQALEREPGNPAALRALMDIHRASGRTGDALAAAEQLAESQPDDVRSVLDVAELSLELDRPDDALVAYTRLRAIDDDPEHEVYAYHGMIEAEIRRGEWRRALDLGIEATRVDRYGRTTDVLAYVVTQVFGRGDREAPERKDVDAALAASRAEHRRLHEEGFTA